jgi:periplasmic divalent cation tolerance protein
MNDDFLLVQTSIDSEDAAQQLADTLVDQRLAACCWVSGPMRSTYWWKGVHERAQEWVCQFKTRKDLYPELEQAIKLHHSYEEPEIVALPIVAGSASFLAWIEKETKPHTS